MWLLKDAFSETHSSSLFSTKCKAATYHRSWMLLLGCIFKLLFDKSKSRSGCFQTWIRVMYCTEEKRCQVVSVSSISTLSIQMLYTERIHTNFPLFSSKLAPRLLLLMNTMNTYYDHYKFSQISISSRLGLYIRSNRLNTASVGGWR